MDIRQVFAAKDLDRYSSDGFIVPHGDFLSDMVNLGLTAEICRGFGRWASPHRITFVPSTQTFKYVVDDVEFQINVAVGRISPQRRLLRGRR